MQTLKRQSGDALGRKRINVSKFFSPASAENAGITKSIPRIVSSYTFACQQWNRALVFFVPSNTYCRQKTKSDNWPKVQYLCRPISSASHQGEAISTISTSPRLLSRRFLGKTYGVQAIHSLPEQMGCWNASCDELLFFLFNNGTSKKNTGWWGVWG